MQSSYKGCYLEEGQFFSGMLAVMLAKFVTNDIPHAVGASRIDVAGTYSYKVFRALAYTGSLDIVDMISAGAATASEICDPLGIPQNNRLHMLSRLLDTRVLFRRASLSRPRRPYIYYKNDLLDYLRGKTNTLAHNLLVDEMHVYQALSSSDKTTAAVLHVYFGLSKSTSLIKVMGLGIHTSFIRAVLRRCTDIGILKVQKVPPDPYGVLYSAIDPVPPAPTEYVLLYPEVVEVIGIARDIFVKPLRSTVRGS